MNKKIFVLMMVGMFLLFTFQAISAVETESNIMVPTSTETNKNDISEIIDENEIYDITWLEAKEMIYEELLKFESAEEDMIEEVNSAINSLEDFGTKDDMKLSQVKQIYNKNKEFILQNSQKELNLFCKVDITAQAGDTMPGSLFPRYFYSAVAYWYGHTNEFRPWETRFLIDGLYGKQYDGEGPHTGILISFFGNIIPIWEQYGQAVVQLITLNGFAIISYSDIPFVD